MRFRLRTLIGVITAVVAIIAGGRYALQMPERRALPFSARNIRDNYEAWLDWSYGLSAEMDESEFVSYVQRLGLAESFRERGVYESTSEEKADRVWHANGRVHVEAFGD